MKHILRFTYIFVAASIFFLNTTQPIHSQGVCNQNTIGRCDLCPQGYMCTRDTTDILGATCQIDPSCGTPAPPPQTNSAPSTSQTSQDNSTTTQSQTTSGEIPADPISNHFTDFTNILAPKFSKTLSEDNFVGALIGRLLPFLLVFGGLLLLIMLISGGFQLLTNPTNPQAQEGGKQRLLYAIIGFFLLFVSYWLMQILEVIFGIKVL